MFSFHPVASAGLLSDPAGVVHRRKMAPSLGAAGLSLPPAEGSPSSSSSPSFVHPNQSMQHADGTSPTGCDTLATGTFPHLQPFFAALARNLANISPQQPQTNQRSHGPNSVPPNSNSNAALSSPPFAFSNAFLGRQQKQQQTQNSPPIGADAQQQQQMMANWLSFLTMAHGNGGTANGRHSERTAAKTLESDSEGNSVCPACRENIGKEPTQWERHLEAEKSRLRNEIESLRTAVLAVRGIGTSSMETTTAHAHNEQKQRTDGAELALERIRESQRRRITAKISGRFFMSSPIMTKLIKRDDDKGKSNGNKDARDSPKQREENTGDANGDGSSARQSANGFTVSPFSAIELARGFKNKEGDEEGAEVPKRTSPRVSPEAVKRMSPEWTRRKSPEETKRPRMEL